jgi:hypothetical protein
LASDSALIVEADSVALDYSPALAISFIASKLLAAVTRSKRKQIEPKTASSLNIEIVTSSNVPLKGSRQWCTSFTG